MPRISNWFGDLGSTPAKIVPVRNAAEIAAVLKDETNYPSPVRAIGSGHSCTECGEAEGGTVLLMRGMGGIREIGDETLCVEAGAIHLDMARALEGAGKQFYVNTEIGSLTAGSAACCGTKDASMPGEFGMVGSYVTGVRMILPDGTDRAFSDADDPGMMQLIRSSYGTFGVIHEVTFRIRPLRHLKVYHETFRIGDFIARLGELFARGESMMYYIFPFEDVITVEFTDLSPVVIHDAIILEITNISPFVIQDAIFSFITVKWAFHKSQLIFSQCCQLKYFQSKLKSNSTKL